MPLMQQLYAAHTVHLAAVLHAQLFSKTLCTIVLSQRFHLRMFLLLIM
jgi:hypothetical protein